MKISIYKDLDVYLNREASKQEMEMYHDHEYVEYLSKFICSEKYEILKSIACPQIQELLNN
jgi:hypothetical protein